MFNIFSEFLIEIEEKLPKILLHNDFVCIRSKQQTTDKKMSLIFVTDKTNWAIDSFQLSK